LLAKSRPEEAAISILLRVLTYEHRLPLWIYDQQHTATMEVAYCRSCVEVN